MTTTMTSAAYELVIQPRGSLLFRDGRPFAAVPGARAASLDWPLPGTIAGALRTHIGQACGWDWQGDGPERALGIGVAGPLLLARDDPAGPWVLYLAAPRNALTVRPVGASEPVVYRLAPMPPAVGAGCDLPHPALWPLAVDVQAKSEGGAAFWPLEAMVSWLSEPNEPAPLRAACLGHLPKEARTHAAIDHDRRAALEGALFTTEHLVFPDVARAAAGRARAMLCRVEGDLDGWQPGASEWLILGGERGLGMLGSPSGASLWPALPPALEQRLAGSGRLTLTLITPAVFGQGWCPAWLDDDLVGSPPGAPQVRLRLRGAAVGRREAVSGWDRRWDRNRPKAVRSLAPAGSVYFFDVVDGALDAAVARALWFDSLCDDTRDGWDGFGLALPGIW